MVDRAIRVTALLVAGALTAVPAPMAGQGSSAWTEIAAGDVRVVSDADAASALSLLQRVVQARTLIARATGMTAGDAAEPVLVLAPKGKNGMREIVGDASRRNPGLLIAASLPSPYGHHFAIRLGAREARSQAVVLHEYTHLVTRQHLGNVPAWLDEGLSEFWSTLTERGDRLEAGRPIDRYVRRLRRTREWIPVADLVKVPRGRYDAVKGKVELFYAESWALVHYLLFRQQTSRIDFAPELPPDLNSLDRMLRAYVHGPLIGVAFEARPAVSPAPGAVVRELSEAEALAVRASVLAYGEQPERAMTLAVRALSLEPRQPQALEAFGIALFLTNRPEQARARLGDAVRVPGVGYLAHYYYAVLNVDTPAIAVRHLRRSLELRPGFAPALERLSRIAGPHDP